MKTRCLLCIIIGVFLLFLNGCGSDTLPTTTTTTASVTTTTAAVTTTTAAGTTTTTAAGTTTTSTTTTTTTTTTTLAFSVTSSAFVDGARIPTENAHSSVTGGLNNSIPLSWANAPAGTQYFAIAIVDTYTTPDWYHWFVIDIPSSNTSLAEGASMTSMPAGSIELFNESPSQGYYGPAPPGGTGDHNYVTTIYALSTTLNLSGNVTYAEFLSAVSGNLSTATITGTFSQ